MSATAEKVKKQYKEAKLRDTSTKPEALTVDTANIPADLKALVRWLRWRYQLNEKRTKWTKPPIGTSTDPTTWISFGQALESDCDGIGIALGALDNGRWLVGVDVDNCRNPETGKLTDEALAIVKMLNSYAEVSPSGTGIKIFCFADHDVFASENKQVGNLECYSRGRYFCVTGHRLECSSTEVKECTAVLKEFQATYMIRTEENETDLSDTDLATQALNHLAPSRADEYHSWLSVGMALCSVDDSLLEAWEQWSNQSVKYDAGACSAKWNTFTGGQLKLGSLLYWAKQDSGWVPPVKRRNYKPDVDGTFALTDGGNAKRFVAEHGQDVRFCLERGKWFVWDGRRWKVDIRANKVTKLAKKTIKGIREAAAKENDSRERERLWKFADKSDSEARYGSMLVLAQSEDGIAIEAPELNNQPWLFNCSNGTIDLRTGELKEHRKADLITKLCPLEYPTVDTPTPLWDAFLARIFASDATLIPFVQRLMGMSLVGESKEHVLPILYGTGANGKTTLIETWQGVMGPDYAGSAPSELLVGGKNEHPTIFTQLAGKRFMAAGETDDGCRLNEATVKRLTGGDTICARGMREDYWTFTPEHTLVLATNHKPIVRGNDLGIWRRLKLIPFLEVILVEEQDKELAKKLAAEGGAILRWMVQGCLAWQRDGLLPPQAVEVATSDYRADSDTLAQFIEECCDVGPALEETAAEFYRVYKWWAERGGTYVKSSKALSLDLEQKGFAKVKRGGVVYYQGVKTKMGVYLPERAA